MLTTVRLDVPLQLFISAREEFGNTVLLKAIFDAVICLQPGGCVTLAMTTTGIAANRLHLVRTFHSRLKAPIHIDENGTLGIKAQTGHARLVAMSKIILIDEATMLHEFYLRALDRTLCDIMFPYLPFEGKILVLAGDFKISSNGPWSKLWTVGEGVHLPKSSLAFSVSLKHESKGGGRS